MNHDEQRRQSNDILELKLVTLKVISMLGKGGKGVVFLVRDGDTGEFWALKSTPRGIQTEDTSDERKICVERRVLSSLDHPLLPKLHGVLVTDKILGYAIDYCPGRDLNQLRKKQSERMFSDDFIRFYAAEIVIALEYLHNQGIVYRDLKPENIMLQENGHIMLIDFDLSTNLSRQNSPENSPGRLNSASSSVSSSASARTESEKSNSFVGTEDYVAPEIVSGKGHDYAVDWWSLGVVLYEMLYGTTPFKGSNTNETFNKILRKQPDLAGETTPLRDLIKKLLEKEPTKRIGLDGIKGHDFFTGVRWSSVVEISRTPYIPSLDELSSGDTKGMKDFDLELYVEKAFGKPNDDDDKISPSKNQKDFLVF